MDLRVASTRRARRRGLARRPPEGALWLIPCRSIHTFGMRYPLDLVWLDRAGAVLEVCEGVPPRRIVTRLRAHSVIETPAGEGRTLAATW